MRIEHLSSPGCPNAVASYRLLARCVAEVVPGAAVIERVGAFASPTVLVNGIDVMRPDQPLSEACCRLDLPSRAAIITALRRGAQTDGDHRTHRDR